MAEVPGLTCQGELRLGRKGWRAQRATKGCIHGCIGSRSWDDAGSFRVAKLHPLPKQRTSNHRLKSVKP